MNRPTKFVVDRGKWLRGGSVVSFLLDRKGNMCCLGFVSEQCGVSRDHLYTRGTPWGAWNAYRDALSPVFGLLIDEYAVLDGDGDTVRSETPLACKAIDLNDEHTIDDAKRESELIALFAEHGCELEFVGEGKP